MLSIQELWCKKLRPKGRGGLGYRYHKHFTGGAIGDDDWNPDVYDTYSVDSWIPESTVSGFNPYPIGINEYEEYTPEQMKYFTTMRDVNNILNDQLPDYILKDIPLIDIKALNKGAPKQPKEILQYTRKIAEEERVKKERETQFNEKQKLINIKKQELKAFNDELEKRSKEIINVISKKIQSEYASKRKKYTLKKIKEDHFSEIEQELMVDKEIQELIVKILKLDNDILLIDQSTENITFEPEYHERLISGREELTLENEELFNDILDDAIPELDETFNTWYDETYIKDILPLYAEIETPKPDYFKQENIETMAEVLGVDSGAIFEDLDNYPDNLLLGIIKTLDPSFNDKNISEIVKINTNNDYDNGEFKFKGTDWAPLDNIVIIKYNDGNMAKYTIENKYYDKTSILTGEKGKRGIITKGEKTTFKDILDYNTSRFNAYKKDISSKFSYILKDYNDNIVRGYDDNDIKEEEPELYEQYHNYLTMYRDDNNLTESFYKNVFLPGIPMKLSKTNFQYKYAKHTEGGVTKSDFYDYFHKDAKIIGKTRTQFNTDGTIQGIYNSQSDKPVTNKGYDLFKDSKVLYLVSFKDALLGMNWSKTLNTLSEKHKSFFDNPLYLRHPTQSAYGAHATSTGRLRRYTDSLALRPTDFIVLNGKI